MSGSPFSRPRLNDRRPAAASSGAAAPAGPTLAEALAEQPAVLRIRYRRYSNGRGYHDLTGYAADGRLLLWLDRDDDTDKLRKTALIAYVRASYPHVDWTRDHDVHLDGGHVYSTPLAEHDGYLPELDGTFGGSAPVYLPCRIAVPA